MEKENFPKDAHRSQIHLLSQTFQTNNRPLSQINVSPPLECHLAIFREFVGSWEKRAGGRGVGASAITHVSLPDKGRWLSAGRTLCVLSVSPSQLNAFDCTAHRPGEVSSQTCITTHMSRQCCFSTQMPNSTDFDSCLDVYVQGLTWGLNKEACDKTICYQSNSS